MSLSTIVNRNWKLLQIGRRLFHDVIQTATRTYSYSGPCPDLWMREVHLIGPVRFEFRFEGLIRFTLLRAKYFLTFKVRLPCAKFLCSRHLCHNNIQCLEVS